MKVSESKWTLKDEHFGLLLPYIKDDNVTDINYNGQDVWIDDLMNGRYKADITLTKEFVNQFSTKIADIVSESFNQYEPLLEAETDVLRISILHETVANTGRSISIRKTPIIKRFDEEKALKEGYCTEEVLRLLKNCVAGKMNMVVCGLPGAGKTELLKFLTGYIPSNDRVITIEDNLEIHYPQINPGKDCVELKVNDDRFTYIKAIKACLRQNPQWILLSEARSAEVKYLIESLSTGTHCLTTIHTDDVRKVPDRIKNMVQDSITEERMENDAYNFLDVGILVRKKEVNKKIIRYIDQLCFYSREKGGKNIAVMIVDNGKIVNKNIPDEIVNKFKLYNISDPFTNELTEKGE